MIIKDNMANMCAKVTSTYMEFTLAFGPKPEFSFSFKYYHFTFWFEMAIINEKEQMFEKVKDVERIILHSDANCFV